MTTKTINGLKNLKKLYDESINKYKDMLKPVELLAARIIIAQDKLAITENKLDYAGIELTAAFETDKSTDTLYTKQSKLEFELKKLQDSIPVMISKHNKLASLVFDDECVEVARQYLQYSYDYSIQEAKKTARHIKQAAMAEKQLRRYQLINGSFSDLLTAIVADIKQDDYVDILGDDGLTGWNVHGHSPLQSKTQPRELR